MNIRTDYDNRCQTYTLRGKESMLVCDGALDHDVWDQLTAQSPAEARDQFVHTLYDPRLTMRGSALTAAAFGPDWKDNGKKSSIQNFVLGDPQGPHQSVEVKTGGMSGNDFKVLTVIPGVVEHEMSGGVSIGGLNDVNTREQVTVP